MNVFVSHTKQGAQVASQLADDLKRLEIDVQTGQTLVNPGEPWAARIADAIKSADVLLVVVAKDSGTSRWQSTETALAIAGFRANKTIIPVLVSKDVEIPHFLRQFQAIDLSNEVKYKIGLEKLLRTLSAPRPIFNPSEALRSHGQLLEAQKLALEAAKTDLRQSQVTHLSQVARMVLLLLLGILQAMIVISLFNYPEKMKAIVGVATLTTIASFFLGQYFAKSSDYAKKLAQKLTNCRNE